MYPDIVVVCGLPGTGKTTFAKALATAIDADHHNSDKVRHASRKRGQYELATRLKIYESLRELAETSLAAKRSVVIDATFYLQKMRKYFLPPAVPVNVTTAFIHMTAEESLIEQRTAQRRTYSEANFDVYLKLKSGWEPLEYPHLVLESESMPLEDLVNKATRYLLKSGT
ncbi:MAG: ATP-binding protein [Bacteroidota bacterium]